MELHFWAKGTQSGNSLGSFRGRCNPDVRVCVLIWFQWTLIWISQERKGITWRRGSCSRISRKRGCLTRVWICCREMDRPEVGSSQYYRHPPHDAVLVKSGGCLGC